MTRLALLVALLALVSACTTVRQMDDSPERRAQREALLAAGDWELSGRIAVASESGEGNGQANLRWSQAESRATIWLTGPFGAGSTEMVWTPGQVTVSTAGEERSMEYTGPRAAERFMQDQVGWGFPVASARYWVLGLIDPAAPGQEFFDAAGGITGLRQHGWDLSFERFVEVDGLTLPTRMTMQNPRVRLKVVVSRWKLLDDAA